MFHPRASLILRPNVADKLNPVTYDHRDFHGEFYFTPMIVQLDSTVNIHLTI